MNPLLKAQEEGYSDDEIINFLSNAYPTIRKSISKAASTGYSTKEIVNFLANLIGKNKQQPSSNTKGMSQQSVHAMKMQEDEAKQEQLVKNGLSLAGGAIAGRALQNVAPKLGNMLGKMGGISSSPKQTAESPVAQAFGASAQIPKVPTPPVAPTPIKPEEVYEKGKGTIEKLGLGQKIRRLVESNSSENIPALLDKLVTPENKAQIEQETGLPFTEAIKNYAQVEKGDLESLARNSINRQADRLNAPPSEEIEPIQAKPLIQKSNENKPEIQSTQEKLVALPDGQVGTLLEERQGIGTVELSNGKKRRQKISELEREPPELTEDIITAVQNLLKIPESERSSIFNSIEYGPKTKRLIIRFHSGDVVEYDDVEEDVALSLAQGNLSPKTTGGNMYGTFSPDNTEKSRGATYHKAIRSNPKYAKENEEKTWRYLRKVYAYWHALEKKPKKRKNKES